MADPTSGGILASLLALVALMVNREVRELKDRRRNGNGNGKTPLPCALAKERYDALSKQIEAVADHFIGKHGLLKESASTQESLLREIRDTLIRMEITQR